MVHLQTSQKLRLTLKEAKCRPYVAVLPTLSHKKYNTEFLITLKSGTDRLIKHVLTMDGIMHKSAISLTHIKKTTKIDVIGSNNLINIRVSHSGLDHLVTDFVTFLC